MTSLMKIIIASGIFLVVAVICGYLTLTSIIKSEDVVVVPALTGKDAIYALEMLTDLRLNIKVKGSEYHADIPKNYIIFQEPSAGDEIKKDRDVHVVLSKGQKSFLLPDLVGMDIRQARIILEENDLNIGNLAKVFDNRSGPDRVMAQTPDSMETVIRGSDVDLLVSLGQRPKALAMPLLVELTLDDAILLLDREGLIMGEIRSTFSKEKPNGVVVAQEPAKGYRVTKGARVHLTINRLKVREISPGGIHVFRYSSPNGFLKRRVRIMMNMQGFSHSLYDAFVKPGEDIRLLVPRDPDVTLFVYEDDELILKKVIY